MLKLKRQRVPVVLDNISLLVEPGQKIAIVGHTGSGKSTLGALLLVLQVVPVVIMARKSVRLFV